jgi:propionate CoA-transferase
VTEIAPGIDLERDVLGQAEFPLQVSPDVRLMEERLFLPEPISLELKSPSESRKAKEEAVSYGE